MTQFIVKYLERSMDIFAHLFAPETYQLLAALLLASALAAFLILNTRLGRPVLQWIGRRPQAFSVLEFVISLMAVIVSLAWYTYLPSPFRSSGYGLGSPQGDGTVLTDDFIAGPALCAAVLLATLLLCFYLFRNRTLFLLFGVGAPLTVFYGLLRWKFFPVVDEIMSQMGNSELWRAFGPGVMVSVLFPGLFLFAAGVAAVLGGLYLSRRGYVAWRYLVGAFVGAFAVCFLSRPFISPGLHNVLLQALMFALAARVMVAMPGARQRLETLSGLCLTALPRESGPPPATLLQRVLAHLALLLILAIVVASAAVNWSERETIRMFYVERRPTYRTFALLNAYPDVSRMFLKDRSPMWSANGSRLEASATRLNRITEDMPDVRDDEYWSKVDAKQLFADLDQFTSFTVPYRAAAEKDYLEEPTMGQNLSFFNIRECSRALNVHALLCIRDGRTTEALQDVRSTVGFGALLRNHYYLVGQMMGAVVRGLGLDAAYAYYVRYRREPDKLRELARLLDEIAPKMRTSLNVEGLRRGEPATLPIAVMAEIMVPALGRAEKNMNTRWLNFEALRVAVAVELYRADRGSYPARLEDLVPGYLKVLPVDPFKGLPLTYIVKGDEYVIDSPSKVKERNYDEFFAFPPPNLDELKQGNRTK